jgi:hypothetical protein
LKQFNRFVWVTQPQFRGSASDRDLDGTFVSAADPPLIEIFGLFRQSRGATQYEHGVTRMVSGNKGGKIHAI